MSKSVRAQQMSREVDVDQYLDVDGLLYLWQQIKAGFVAIVPGKGLSTNDFTNAYKEKLDNYTPGGGTADAVAWANITGKPELYTKQEVDTELDAIDADLGKLESTIGALPTVEQVQQLIASAVSSVYRFAGSVPAYENLPTSGMSGGDVYNVEDTDMNYAWVAPTGRSAGYWDPLGTTFNIETIPNSVIQQIVEGTYGQ